MIKDIRKQFPSLSKEEFDASILQQAEFDYVILHHHDHPYGLTPQERDNDLVFYPEGTDDRGKKTGQYFVALSFNPDDFPPED